MLSTLSKGVDILVVGGGINGAGIFRDAAMRGLSIGLIEMNDFGSGTSSRSSKLIHGGVRYLENMDFGLVMESSMERTLLMKLIPDLVKPSPFILPVYNDSPHGLFVMDFGLWLYDALAFFRNFRLHKKLSKNETIKNLPELKQNGLKGSVLYYDCRVNDARLVINNIMSGISNNGLAMNYCEAVEIGKKDGSISSVIAKDRLNGQSFQIPCKVIISATGPWTNSFYHKVEGIEKNILRLTKGIHLVFPEKRFKTETSVVITSKDDRRIAFIIPWEEFTLVGTTDTDFNGDLDGVYSDKSDVEYLLKLVNEYFPGLSLKPCDAISAFAGLRPLVLSGGSASSVSRKDKIIKSSSGIFFIGGGKLTTYRHISEKAVDHALKELPLKTRQKSGRCLTAKLPLIDKPVLKNSNTGDSLNDNLLSPDIIEYLIARYGKGASEVILIAKEDPELSRRIAPGLPFIFAEIPYGVKNEMLLTLTDFFRLRTEIYLKTPDNGLAVIDQAMKILAKEINLSDEAAQIQVNSYKSYLKLNLGCIGKCSDSN